MRAPLEPPAELCGRPLQRPERWPREEKGDGSVAGASWGGSDEPGAEQEARTARSRQAPRRATARTAGSSGSPSWKAPGRARAALSLRGSTRPANCGDPQCTRRPSGPREGSSAGGRSRDSAARAGWGRLLRGRAGRPPQTSVLSPGPGPPSSGQAHGPGNLPGRRESRPRAGTRRGGDAGRRSSPPTWRSRQVAGPESEAPREGAGPAGPH